MNYTYNNSISHVMHLENIRDIYTTNIHCSVDEFEKNGDEFSFNEIKTNLTYLTQQWEIYTSLPKKNIDNLSLKEKFSVALFMPKENFNTLSYQVDLEDSITKTLSKLNQDLKNPDRTKSKAMLESLSLDIHLLIKHHLEEVKNSFTLINSQYEKNLKFMFYSIFS